VLKGFVTAEKNWP